MSSLARGPVFVGGGALNGLRMAVISPAVSTIGSDGGQTRKRTGQRGNGTIDAKVSIARLIEKITCHWLFLAGGVALLVYALS